MTAHQIAQLFPLIFFFPFLLFFIPLINKIKKRNLKFFVEVVTLIAGIIFLAFVLSMGPLLIISLFIFIGLLIYNAVKGYFKD
jgi:hypothetical protein